MFTRVRHCFCSCARRKLSTPTLSVSLRSISIFSHVPRSFKWSVPFRSPDKNVVLAVLSPVSSSIGSACYLTKNRNYDAPHYEVFALPPVTVFLLDTNILLFPNTLSLCCSLRMTDEVSNPHSTTGKCVVICILIFTFLDRRLT